MAVWLKSAMGSNPVFTHTERAVLPILEELRQREPIFSYLGIRFLASGV